MTGYPRYTQPTHPWLRASSTSGYWPDRPMDAAVGSTSFGSYYGVPPFLPPPIQTTSAAVDTDTDCHLVDVDPHRPSVAQVGAVLESPMSPDAEPTIIGSGIFYNPVQSVPVVLSRKNSSEVVVRHSSNQLLMGGSAVEVDVDDTEPEIVVNGEALVLRSDSPSTAAQNTTSSRSSTPSTTVVTESRSPSRGVDRSYKVTSPPREYPDTRRNNNHSDQRSNRSESSRSYRPRSPADYRRRSPTNGYTRRSSPSRRSHEDNRRSSKDRDRNSSSSHRNSKYWASSDRTDRSRNGSSRWSRSRSRSPRRDRDREREREIKYRETSSSRGERYNNENGNPKDSLPQIRSEESLVAQIAKQIDTEVILDQLRQRMIFKKQVQAEILKSRQPESILDTENRPADESDNENSLEIVDCDEETPQPAQNSTISLPDESHRPEEGYNPEEEDQNPESTVPTNSTTGDLDESYDGVLFVDTSLNASVEDSYAWYLNAPVSHKVGENFLELVRTNAVPTPQRSAEPDGKTIRTFPKKKVQVLDTNQKTRQNHHGKSIPMNVPVDECYEFFSTGSCQCGNLCMYAHGGSKEHHFITFCRKFMSGECPNTGDCPNGSHALLPHQMPVCAAYLRQECFSKTCQYLHVKHRFGQKLCIHFNRAHCFATSPCVYVHRYNPNIWMHRCATAPVSQASELPTTTTTMMVAPTSSSSSSSPPSSTAG